MTEGIALYPLLLMPSLRVRVWGGRRLASVLGKTLPSEEPYGESWELHDTSTVVNGPLAGKSVGDLLADYGAALVGREVDPAEGFPLLAKLLDASDWLSVQVHPNDEQARALEGDPRGKTEAWVILAADPGARLGIGVRPGTAREDLAAAIRENRLEDLLVYADVRAGDVLYLAANTIHAIGPGLLIYEIQQSSDVTYRLYDWGRMGLDGKPRPLHVEKGVQVSNVASLPRMSHVPDSDAAVAVDGAYFTTVAQRLHGDPLAMETGGHFQALTCIEGALELSGAGVTVTLRMGQTALVPASVGAYTLSGTGRLLRSWETG